MRRKTCHSEYVGVAHELQGARTSANFRLEYAFVSAACELSAMMTNVFRDATIAAICTYKANVAWHGWEWQRVTNNVTLLDENVERQAQSTRRSGRST
jgi:hypothetical protein